MSLFSTKPFAHEHLERFFVAFGNLFGGITIQKKDSAGNKLQTYEIPIEYAPKNKWVARIREQNDLQGPQIKMTLPRMAFEIDDIRYAPDRKIGVNGCYAIGEFNGMRGKIFPPTPYDVIINLYCITKDQKADTNQIVEQILPYFQPFLMVNYEILPEYKITKDVPVSFTGYQVEDTYAGSPEEQRTITQIFTFSAQMDFFGPNIVTTAIIKDAFVNFTFAKGGPVAAQVEEKINPLTASKTDPYAIIETLR